MYKQKLEKYKIIACLLVLQERARDVDGFSPRINKLDISNYLLQNFDSSLLTFFNKRGGLSITKLDSYV